MAKAPTTLSIHVASLFARAAEPSSAVCGANKLLRLATVAMSWQCVLRGGSNALETCVQEISNTLADGFRYEGAFSGNLHENKIWADAGDSALTCLQWDSATVEDRREIALALMLAHLHGIRASSFTTMESLERKLIDIAAGISHVLVAACVAGAMRILQDQSFDLEQILCDEGQRVSTLPLLKHSVYILSTFLLSN